MYFGTFISLKTVCIALHNIIISITIVIMVTLFGRNLRH